MEVVEDFAPEAEQRVLLANAVSHLDQRDRELIALRYGADLTARQIAEVMDMQTNAVEVALHRALARLRGDLEGGHGDEHPSPEPRAEPTR